jgi:hypothetical protein
MNLEQIRAILWLRQQLWRNYFARSGRVNAVLWFVVVGVLALAGVASGLLGVFGGWLASRARPPALMFLWDGVILAFLFFWMMGLVVEVQRAESIGLAKLLHLPITLRQVFIFNYVASHFTPALVLFLPAMLGLCVGLGAGTLGWMGLMIGPVVGFVFMITAWTYCLRGWLAALMIDKRRHRTVVVWITLIFVGVSQLPNLVFNSRVFKANIPKQTEQVVKSSRNEVPENLAMAHLVFPPGWPGYAAMRLRQGNAWPAVGVACAAAFIGVAGLSRAYRSTIRFYQGGYDSGTSRALKVEAVPPKHQTLLVERSIPGFSEDTSALAMATLRSLLRAPELKMALIMPIFMILAVGYAHIGRKIGALGGVAATFAATAAAVGAVFSIAPTMSNCFALDRDGFRALILAPLDRRKVLLAKNAAFFPFAAITALVLLLALKFLFGISWGLFFAGLIQTTTAFLLFALACNAIATLFPFRLAAATLQAKKMNPRTLLAVLLTMFVVPLLILPVILGPALQLILQQLCWVTWLPANFLTSLVVLGLVCWLYHIGLPLEGRLLLRREKAILREVTEELE